jgi:hypothetical protein
MQMPRLLNSKVWVPDKFRREAEECRRNVEQPKNPPSALCARKGMSLFPARNKSGAHWGRLLDSPKIELLWNEPFRKKLNPAGRRGMIESILSEATIGTPQTAVRSDVRLRQALALAAALAEMAVIAISTYLAFLVYHLVVWSGLPDTVPGVRAREVKIAASTSRSHSPPPAATIVSV